MDFLQRLKSHLGITTNNKVPLDPAWQECKDDFGNTYYYNSTTGQSSWVAPGSLNPEISNKSWKEAQDEEGQTYYWNELTGETSWSLPAGVAAEDRWDECKDEEGNVYYYNPKTNESSWENPTQKKSTPENQPKGLMRLRRKYCLLGWLT
jgi:hypothetical protein